MEKWFLFLKNYSISKKIFTLISSQTEDIFKKQISLIWRVKYWNSFSDVFYPSVSLIFFKFRHLKVTATNLGWIMPDGFVIILEQTDKCFKYLEKHQTSLQRVLLSKLLLGTFFLSPVVITWVNEERMNSGIRLFKLTERIIRVFE